MVRWTAALAISAIAGYVCTLLHTPIPWMLGPLFALAFLRIAGVDIGAPAPTRYLGQWIIGTSLGLYFTPYVMRQLGDLWWLLVAGALFAIALGIHFRRRVGTACRIRQDDGHLRQRAGRSLGDGGAR
jgi:uncharacterized membrane protein AbrB (regulator of aidB expression)